ncbi:sensor histidine kinase [Krasilnikovia sp. MM14-A1259]|uniref:sensor histidine kinase n=1 Tax=Krasilnikovia sp. MM14-A1259 TaxID=3373539 RepID=UPI0037F7DC4D
MSLRASLLRTVLFVSAYLATVVVSRAPIAAHGGLHELWPSAGVAAMWLVAQRGAPARWVDPAVLLAATVGVNLVVGQPMAVAVLCGLIVGVQVAAFRWLLSHPHPNTGGDAPRTGLRRPADLWPLLVAAVGATAAGAAVGFPGLWLATGTFVGVQTATMLLCTLTCMLLYGGLALQVGAKLSAQRARYGSLAAAWRQIMRDTTRARAYEYLAVVGCSLAGYGLTFGLSGVTMVFPLLALSVYSAVRLSTIYVFVFSAVVTFATSASTLWESGPFAMLGSPQGQVLVAHAFAATSALIGLTLALSRDERAAVTSELAEEKAQASRQADLMNAIVNSMADGLAVEDRDGRLVMHNPAVATLLGRVRTHDVDDASSFYGFRRLDGSPIADHELPHRKVTSACQGHSMDVLVSNSDLPHDRIVRLTATPLTDPDGSLDRSVVLIRDVTAETRQRDELASFAGVVAHDLLNPLTTVEGWTEAVDETLGDIPEHPAVAAAHTGLARVERAAARMRGLVNDLLAYTTTRDASITPAPVDLTKVVTDVADARIDTAMAAEKPVPVFTVGDLHPVHADPVLIRQLLDNLVSNAVKYTAPGVIPHIWVTGACQDDTVTVTVADNGIGIPAGQHAAIFDTFHRAHRGKGYAGTGLGLAICKRTVERHGGTITAADNPGGGTRFTFTLPADITTGALDVGRHDRSHRPIRTPERVA